jgi:hypothetical protein
MAVLGLAQSLALAPAANNNNHNIFHRPNKIIIHSNIHIKIIHIKIIHTILIPSPMCRIIINIKGSICPTK